MACANSHTLSINFPGASLSSASIADEWKSKQKAGTAVLPDPGLAGANRLE
jgi:hypothetical protein